MSVAVDAVVDIVVAVVAVEGENKSDDNTRSSTSVAYTTEATTASWDEVCVGRRRGI